MQHTAAFMGRRQRAASLTLRGKFAGGRRGCRPAGGGGRGEGCSRQGGQPSRGRLSECHSSHPEFFLSFLVFGDSPGWPLSGCVAEDNLEFLILLPPPPTYVYS